MCSSLTASQIDRAHACPASFALPIVTLPAKPESQRGSAIHHFLEVAVNQGRDVALAEVPADAPWRSLCEQINIDELIVDAVKVECEVALAYNPVTGRGRVSKIG